MSIQATISGRKTVIATKPKHPPRNRQRTSAGMGMGGAGSAVKRDSSTLTGMDLAAAGPKCPELRPHARNLSLGSL